MIGRPGTGTDGAAQRTMPTLAEETWLSCSAHEMTLTFLRSEWANCPTISANWDHRLIAQCDIANRIDNNLRAQMLWSIRGALLQQIPGDTQWFRVQYLRRIHFSELRVINYPTWNSATDMNELEKAARRMPQEIWRGTKDEWSPILWAHDPEGPFTIIEGNHRLTALAQPGNDVGLELVAYVGLSSNRCNWHLPDAVS
jgi:hypothetical protein